MITSFIIHYLDWQDRKRLREGRKKPVGHLTENAAIRSSDLPPNGIPGPWRVCRDRSVETSYKATSGLRR